MINLTQERASVGRTAETAVAALMSRFNRDERGAVAMTFGLMVLPCVMLVGMAVDYGRMIAAKQMAQVLVDNATLAGGRIAQLNNARLTSGTYGATVEGTVRNYFSQNADGLDPATGRARFFPQTVRQTVGEVVTFPSPVPGEFNVKAMLWVKTPFISTAQMLASKAPTDGMPGECGSSGWNCFPVEINSTVKIQTTGQNDGYSMETSLMLDITGSMSGSKIVDLKAAAKDLIDVVVWPGQDQGLHTSKVALAPFAQTVNVGTYASAVTGRPATSTGSQLTASGGNAANGLSAGTGALRPCVIERLGANAATDEVPSASNGWIGSYGGNNAPAGHNYNDSMSSIDADYNSDGSCTSSAPEDATIVPLTNNKTTLTTRINDMQLGSGTAGHLGTAWAWYMLSPKWNSIWPTQSQPMAYSKIDTKEVKKVAVLMTDGDYNTDYSSSGSSQAKALALCNGMKAVKIEVFTVGFMVSDAARTFLRDQCATDASHYYDATSGDALKAAFRDIALKITPIRVTH